MLTARALVGCSLRVSEPGVKCWADVLNNIELLDYPLRPIRVRCGFYVGCPFRAHAAEVLGVSWKVEPRMLPDYRLRPFRNRSEFPGVGLHHKACGECVPSSDLYLACLSFAISSQAPPFASRCRLRPPRPASNVPSRHAMMLKLPCVRGSGGSSTWSSCEAAAQSLERNEQ